MEAERILIACQTKGRSEFASEVITLFKSIKIFGGKLAQAQKIVYFTDNVEDKIKSELKQLGVKIRIIEDVEVALFEDKCFWITSPRMDNPIATQSMWNWQGYLSWSLVNNNVNITNYNFSPGGVVRAPNDKEQLLFLHIALGVPDKNGKQSLYFKLLPKSAMRDHIRGPMSNQVMAGHYLKHPLMVNWNIPIKIFFCDGQDYNFLNWDGSPFIKQ